MSQETLEAYATVLADESDYQLDVENFLDAINEHLVDVETWAGNDVLYPVDGRGECLPSTMV